MIKKLKLKTNKGVEINQTFDTDSGNFTSEMDGSQVYNDQMAPEQWEFHLRTCKETGSFVSLNGKKEKKDVDKKTKKSS